VSVQYVHYNIVYRVCVCVHIYMIRCCAATRPVCGGSNKPPRVQPVISRQSALYCIYYTLTHKYMCTYDRPSAGIKIIQIYRARSVQVHRAALDLLRSVRVFGRSARIVYVCVHARVCVCVCVCACELYAL